MSEYVDVVIIENGKKIGSFKAERITKEKAEKKDEIKNKISMALKDPILQQGFEIICKNLSELEKENAELKALMKSEHEIEARKNNSLISQIAKAKELLNEFMRISKASDEDFEHDYSELIAETEQFLTEV